LIDVRSPSEFATGHVPGAINIPMEEVPGRVADLDQDRPVVLVCQSGKRATLTNAA
jgi:rhodanese-related sulfurtransferase